MRLAGCIGLALLSAFYCFPFHPSAGSATALDAAVHVAFFSGITFGFARFVGSGRWAVATLACLGVLLEVVQWWVGGYPRVEVADIVANEAGVALAAALLWTRKRRKYVRQ